MYWQLLNWALCSKQIGVSLEFLTEIFSNKAQQAQLITVLLSVTVAILAVLLNQWFLNRRAKRENLLGKLEALYLAIEEYDEFSHRLLIKSYATSPVANEDQVNDLNNKTQEIYKKITMYLDLYFSDQKIDISECARLTVLAFLDYQVNRASIHNVISKKEVEKLNNKYSKDATEVLNILESLKALVVKLVAEHKH